MSLVGVSPEDIARHVGWKSLQTAQYYTQTPKVMKMSHAASALAESTSVAGSDPSAAVSVAELFRIKNKLRGFTLAVPQLSKCFTLVKGSYLFSEFLERVSLMFVWISLTLSCFDCFKSGSWWQNVASHYLVSQRQSVVVLNSENGLLFLLHT